MITILWKRVFFLLYTITLLCIAAPAGAEKLPKLILSGPPGTVSFPLMHMAESGALADYADSVEFTTWRDPDQLRLMALDNKAQILAIPTNVAANLYNRGIKLKLANVSVWGMLWIVSREADAKTLADFKGKEIAMPFRGDMPDIIFELVARAQGLDPRKDFKLRYVGTPFDALQLLITRRVDQALLAEPAVSMALHKTRSLPISIIAPTLYRSVDMQQEWGKALQRSPRIPQAGIAILGEMRNNPQFIAAVNAAYQASLQWCMEQAKECGEMAVRHSDMLEATAATDSVAASILDVKESAQARDELEYFFDVLMKSNPATIGKHLPDDGFYYTAQ